MDSKSKCKSGNVSSSLQNEAQTRRVLLNAPDTQPECKARLTKLLECLRNLFWMFKCNGDETGLNLISRGSLHDLLVCSIMFKEDFGWVFFKNDSEGGNCPTPLVKEDLVDDLLHACARETSKLIVQELGDEYFGIVVDLIRDIREEDYISVCVRYVDKRARVIERFLGIKHVADMSALSLKSGIESLLKDHSLSSSMIRGQSFNGVVETNINGGSYGLTTLVMEETKSAYHVHCFAQYLQSRLSAVAKRNVDDCLSFFTTLEDLINLINESCKKEEMYREITTQKFLEAFRFDEIESGGIYGLNQEHDLMRTDCFCSGPDQYKFLLRIVSSFPVIVDVLYMIGTVCPNGDHLVTAQMVMYKVLSFEFAFVSRLMMSIAGYTNELSLAVQRNDIQNVISLLPVVKEQLRTMRDNRWETLLNDVCSFCAGNEIEVPDMSTVYVRGSRRFINENITNLLHYRDDVFFRVIDLHLEELNSLFNEVSVELLTGMACLSPANCFSSFDLQKVIRLAEFYPNEFSSVDMLMIEYELDMYIMFTRRDERFANLKNLDELAEKLVETRVHDLFPLVYVLLKLVLVLPVVIPNEERVSSAMKFVKLQLHGSIGNQLLNDSLITLVERDVFSRVLDEDVFNSLRVVRASRKQM